MREQKKKNALWGLLPLNIPVSSIPGRLCTLLLMVGVLTNCILHASAQEPLVIKAEETRLEAGDKVDFAFTPAAGQQKYYLSLDSRLELLPKKSTGGNNWALNVQVNGKALDSERVVNYPDDPYTLATGLMANFYSKKHEMFRVHYSPDWRQWTGVISDGAPAQMPNYPYTLVFDISDLVKPGQANQVTVTNKVRNVSYPMAVQNIKILPQYASIRVPQNAAILDVGVVQPQTKTKVDYRLDVLPGGGLKVTVGADSYAIYSGYTYPEGKWNQWRDVAGVDNEWKPEPVQTQGNEIRYTASGKYYTLQRRLVRMDDRIEVFDTLRNLSPTDLGLMTKQAVTTAPGELAALRVSGIPIPSQSIERGEQIRNMENPSLYAQKAGSGLGLFLIDDVSRANCYIKADAGEKSLQNRKLVLGKDGSYTLHWAIFPTARPDYYEFVNAGRRMLGVNFLIDGNLTFAHGFAENIQDKTDQEIIDLVRINNAKYIGLSTITAIGPDMKTVKPTNKRTDFDYGSAYTSEQGKYNREAIRIAADRFHKLCPGVKVIPYFHSFVSAEEGAEDKYADSVLRQADGDVLRYAVRETPYFLPSATNSYGREIQKSLDFNTTVADGIFWDESTAPSALYAYGAWDGYTGDIDPKTFKLLRKGQNLAVASVEYRAQVIRALQAKGKAVWQNFEPATNTEAQLHTYRFVEGFDPQSGYRTHFYTPLSWGNSYTEVDDADVVRSLKEKLKTGALFMTYGVKFGKDGNVMQDIYPFTPQELHPGYVIGAEKILTMYSGRFGWGDASPLSVKVYNQSGYFVADRKVPIVETATGKVADLKLANGEFAIVFRNKP